MSAPATRTAVALSPVTDMDAAVWEATLLYSSDDRPPAVTLQRFKPMQERYAYALVGILDAAADGRGFNFGAFNRDATTHRLSPVAISLLAAEARRRVPATAGHFEVRWLPNDPRVPF